MTPSTPLIPALAAMLALCLCVLPAAAQTKPDQPTPLRPPSVPLIAFNPYLSIWSPADKLTDKGTVHWTQKPMSLTSLIRIDGDAFRLMGTDPDSVPPLPQTGLVVHPTRSVYDFENAKVHVTMTFTTAFLPDDLEVFARPLGYIAWDVRSADGAEHAVEIYDGTSSQLAVNVPENEVEWSQEKMGDLTALKVGAANQTMLRPSGDGVRINWGYAYAVAPTAQLAWAATADRDQLLSLFVDKGTKGPMPAFRQKMPRAANDGEPTMGLAFDLGQVGAETVSRHVIVAYDELYSIDLFGRKLQPYWRHGGVTPAQMLGAAEKEYASVMKKCKAFDEQLTTDMVKAGGVKYAQMAALAYRQALAGCGLAADANGQPLVFPKENSSNGCIATVDVFFPGSPVYLLLNPRLAKGLLVPVMNYSASDRWPFPFAPHDLGTYPRATGMVYGGGENPGNEGDKMPVEESGNMILLLAAVCKIDGNADFASQWWPTITAWAKYLEQYGYDPADQLCTDDFMGHLAHNANLSVKAILALGAYGYMAELRGEHAVARRYTDLARDAARNWTKVADDGDHYRLAFDRPGTWSQKYNLVWDKILGLGIFPDSVAKKEVAHYLKQVNEYGLPLDSRTELTKTDSSSWVATLAGSRAEFEKFIDPAWDYFDHTGARLPMCDTYMTTKIDSDGMRARPVVGGVFIKMLADGQTWKKWASADQSKAGPFAKMPVPPKVTVIVPTSQKQPHDWSYTFDKPSDENWNQLNYDASGWKTGPAAFGVGGTPGVVNRTEWSTPDLWVRREVTLPSQLAGNLQFYVVHDEDVEIYVNGVLAAEEGGFITSYQPLPITEKARLLMTPGAKIVIAAHCHQTTGGQGLDIGMATVEEQPQE